MQDFTTEEDVSLSHRSQTDKKSAYTSHCTTQPDSFHRFPELPQKLLNRVHCAYFEPYHITSNYPHSEATRSTGRQLRPLKELKVHDPYSAILSMTNSRVHSELEELRQDAFDGEVQVRYDETEGLDVLHELCNSNRYSWIRERTTKLVIQGLKGVEFIRPGYLSELWNEIARTDSLPQLRGVDITYEAIRSKFVAKEVDFELPTEEWFKVSAQEYINSFRQGEEDIEYEYPGELLQLQDLKQLLVQNGKPDCEVFLTTRVTWKQLRHETNPPEQNGHESIQSVKFRVVSDDLEGIERIYQ